MEWRRMWHLSNKSNIKGYEKISVDGFNGDPGGDGVYIA